MVASGWDSQFSNWASPPSDSEEARCQNAIRAVKDSIRSDPALNAKSTKVFVQGSYRNNVNVRLNSDVDIGVIYAGAFYADYPSGKDRSDFNHSADNYGFASFKDDLHRALIFKFGSASVSRGNKAFSVKANSYHVDIDVVPLFEYRQYFDTQRYRAGVALMPDKGGRIENFPERLFSYWPDTPLHYENGTSKNNATGRSFKSVVRILKRVSINMSDAGITAANQVPGYLIECLCYNVPNSYFASGRWYERVDAVLTYLDNSLPNSENDQNWFEVDRIKFLFHISQPWTVKQAKDFVIAAIQYLRA